jgi:FixJ family two-component response regulator
LAGLRERFGSLSTYAARDQDSRRAGSPRETIVGDLGIARAAVKVNRSRVMRKMNPGSLPELGRMADKLKFVPEKPQSS